MTHHLKHLVGAAIAAVAITAAMAAPAAAHVLVVDPPGGEPKEGWVGSSALPDAAQGKGLIPGGPTGSYLQSPSHDGGLVTSCQALRTHGNGVVDIFGPTHPEETPTCRHGGR